MAYGGARPGAGRKISNHTIEAAAARAFIIHEVVKNIGPLMEALIEKAKGGDIIAIKEAFERAFGKSKQQIDMTSGDKPIPLLNIVLQKNEQNIIMQKDVHENNGDGENLIAE